MGDPRLLGAVWGAELILALWGWRVAQFYGRRMPRVAARPLAEIFPNVAVIVPIKGVDEHTADNIESLLQQSYPNYRLIFAVESADDTVCTLLARIAPSRAAGKVQVVVAGPATWRGQKVHNQLAAIARTSSQDQILAFMDADAHPHSDWLHALVLPLTYGPHIGATTGYRFYVPVSDHPANGVACVSNAMVGGLFGPYRRTVAWGGSMALRRDDFFSYGIHDAWQGALSDDYVLSYCVKKKAHAKIHFVPRCLVASPALFDWRSLHEFAVRQYRITRICAMRLWLTALAGALLYLFTLMSSFGTALFDLLTGRPGWWMPAGVFILLYTLSILRGAALMLAGKRLLNDHWLSIRRAGFWFTLGFPAVQFITLYYLLCAALGNQITWRGIRYRMSNRTHTRVVSNHA